MTPTLAHPRVYVVLLNWNGWNDTICCLESLLDLDHAPVTVVVCDNGSTDGSLDRLRAWCSRLSRERWTFEERIDSDIGDPGVNQVWLVDNGANLGFAGGCNVGIRLAVARADCEFVWVLNNDTIVEPDALSTMVRHCRANPEIGICGSQVRYAKARHRVQSQGGRLNRWFCTTHLLGGEPGGGDGRLEPIDFVPGASMLVSRRFLEKVGPMAEEFFLYFEEIDWAERGKAFFRFHICPDSVIYHIGGASIGNASDASERGLRADWYLLRGRVLFARKHCRRYLPTVYAGMLVSVIRRLGRRDPRRALVATYAMFNRPVPWLK